MSVRASVAKTAQQSTTLRRSPRFLHHLKTQEPELSTATLRKSQRLVCLEKSAAESENPRTPKSTARSNRVVRSLSLPLSSENSSESHDGPRRSPRLNNGVKGFQSLGRSSRILNKQLVLVDEGKGPSKKISKKFGKLENGSSNCGNLSSGSAKCRRKSVRFCIEQSVVNQCTDKATGSRSKSGKNRSLKKEFSSVGKDGACIVSSERVSKKCKMQEIDGVNKEVGVRRKRKREEENGKREEEGVGVVQGWTKEQELALQRAYLIAKPTPHFWKKVSKLVPGKSAQECLDRVHSEHRTPPQPRTRSRANTLTNSSPLGQFSLSASKLLKPSEPKSKRQEGSKQRRHVAQKTVRQLLQKHYQVYQDYEGDLFWVLEPSLGSPNESHASVIPSTPKNLQEKKKILQNRSQRSSSGHKKPLSRFSSSCGKPLVSPPVLKQVRNKVRHEKYIDQLHTREAKRKAASTRTQQSTTVIGEVDAVRTAKIALVSDARDAINKLQHLQANVTGDSSDFDDGGVISDDEEGEDDT